MHFNTDLGRPARHMSGPAIELSEEGVCYRGVICILYIYMIVFLLIH